MRCWTSPGTLTRQISVFGNRVTELDDERMRELLKHSVEIREIAGKVGDCTLWATTRPPAALAGLRMIDRRRRRYATQGSCGALLNNDRESWILSYASLRSGPNHD
jgi:hypothetical protein